MQLDRICTNLREWVYEDSYEVHMQLERRYAVIEYAVRQYQLYQMSQFTGFSPPALPRDPDCLLYVYIYIYDSSLIGLYHALKVMIYQLSP